MLRLVSTCFAAAVLTVPSLAQEPGPKANLTAKQALLQKVLRKMDSLPSCTFTAKVQNTRLVGAADAARPGAAPPAQLQAAGFAVATSAANAVMNVEGGWGADLLWASANEGKDQVLWHGRRMVGRQGEEPWRLRQGVVGNGTRMPKLFDPETFFQALLHSKLDVIHADVGALEDRPVEIVTVSLTGDDSYDVLWSGLVPDATTNSYLGTRSALAPAARARPEIEVDIAVWLDPATSRVLQCKVRCYTKGSSNAGGAITVLGGGAPAPQGVAGGVAPPQAKPSEDADKAPDAPAGPLAFQDGLPKRAPKEGQVLMLVSYDVTFANHEAAAAPELDANARALLGLPAGK
jgi:hypothetical protein